MITVKPHHASLSLRMWHPTMNGDEATNALGLLPSVVHSAGAKRLDPRGKPLGGEHRRSYWCFEMPVEADGDLTTLLNQIVDRLSVHRDFFASFAGTGGKAEIVLAKTADSHFGEEIAPATLAALGQLSLGIGFDVFFGRNPG